MPNNPIDWTGCRVKLIESFACSRKRAVICRDCWLTKVDE